MRRSRIAVLAAAVVAAGVLAGPAAARAEAGAGKAMVRVAHFSPDASYVDVYMVSLNRKQLFPNVFYKSVSAYWAVAAGPFTYEVRAAGASPESRPVIQVKGTLDAGRAYTVAAVGRRDRLEGLLLRDDLAPSAPGRGKVRFLDAAFDLPPVDIAVSGGPVLRSLAFPEPTGYRQLDSGRYRVEVRRSGADAAVVKGSVAVRPGTVTSVVLVGGAGAPRELYAFSDAAGSRAAPAGGIRTGAGGTAPSFRSTSPTGAVDSREHPLAVLGYPPGRGPIPGVWGSSTPETGPNSGRGGPSRPRLAGARWRVGFQPSPAAGTFDRPADPPAAPGFEVGGLPNRLVVPGGSPPVRLSVPAIGVETPLLRLGLEPDRSMEVPGDFDLAGWFAGGPVPGQPGPAVIAGHVDSRTGPAVFFRLRELRAGDHIEVTRADGTRLRFVVDSTRSFPKARFPTDAVFGPTPAAELRLVTCAGTFDRARGSYRDNLVVFARLESTDGRNQG